MSECESFETCVNVNVCEDVSKHFVFIVSFGSKQTNSLEILFHHNTFEPIICQILLWYVWIQKQNSQFQTTGKRMEKKNVITNGNNGYLCRFSAFKNIHLSIVNYEKEKINSSSSHNRTFNVKIQHSSYRALSTFEMYFHVHMINVP